MGEVSTIGFDIAKQVFQAHGADATGRVVFRKRLVRAKVVEFLAGQAPCVVALEACGGAHHWAREIDRLGHTVNPAYRGLRGGCQNRGRPRVCGAPARVHTPCCNQSPAFHSECRYSSTRPTRSLAPWFERQVWTRSRLSCCGR
jgi:hypothetical protein